MARPSKYETEIKDKLILVQGWARDGLNHEQIAENLGIHISTFYEYKKKYKEFHDVLKVNKDMADYHVVNALYQSALEGNTTAQIFWLKNRMAKEWRDKQEIDHSGSMEINNNFANLTTEELKKLAKGGKG